MRKLFIVHGFLFMVLCSLFIDPAFAASPSPAATDSAKILKAPVQVLGDQASESGVLTSIVDQKLEDIKRGIASRSAQLKSDVNKKIGNKAFLGKISSTAPDRITIEHKSGSKMIKINEYTIYQNDSKQKTKKAFNLDQLQSADTVVCLGDVDETGTMVAKKVIKIDPPEIKSYSFLSGKIGTVDPLSFVISLASGNSKVNYSVKTVIQNGRSEGTATDIKDGREAVVLLVPGTEASQSAFIYLKPETSLVKPK